MNDNGLHKIRRVNTQIYRTSYPGMPMVGYKYIHDDTIQGNIQNRLINQMRLPNIFDYQSTYLPDGFKPPDKIPLSSDFENYAHKFKEAALQSSKLSSTTGEYKVDIFKNEELKNQLSEALENSPIINPEVNNEDNYSDDDDPIIAELEGEGILDFLKPAIGIFKSLLPKVASIAKNPKMISDAAKAVKDTVSAGQDIKKVIVGDKPASTKDKVTKEDKVTNIIKPNRSKSPLAAHFRDLYSNDAISLKSYMTLLQELDNANYDDNTLITIPRVGSSRSSLIDHYHQMYLDGVLTPKAYTTLLQEVDEREDKDLKKEREEQIRLEKEKNKKETAKPAGTGIKRKYTKKVVTGTGVDNIIKDIEELPQEEIKN